MTGRKMPVVGTVEDEDELRKTLGALLIKSPPIITLDNLNFNLSSAFLSEMLTQTYVEPRLLGKSKTVECEWRGIVCATGNNVKLEGDLIRRGLTLRINAKVARPEQRIFSHQSGRTSACESAAGSCRRPYGCPRLPRLRPASRAVGQPSWDLTTGAGTCGSR